MRRPAVCSGHDWCVQIGLKCKEEHLLESQVFYLQREFADLRDVMNRKSHSNCVAFGQLSQIPTHIAVSPALRLVRAAGIG